jgi:hypothetical protein
MPKLTKRFVESVKPAAADQVIFDDDIPGFGLRVLSSGVRSYLVQYRNKQGRSRRLTIGKHGKITADGARKDALRIFDAVRAGRDPVAERRAYIDAPIVNDLLDRYIAEHVERRNRPRMRQECQLHRPTWTDSPRCRAQERQGRDHRAARRHRHRLIQIGQACGVLWRTRHRPSPAL